MNHLFDFDAENTTLKIKLAMEYEPQIMKNSIKSRSYNGLLYIINGSYRYVFEGEEFIAKKNSLIYLPANSKPYTYLIESDGSNPRSMQIEFEISDVKNGLSLSFGRTPRVLTDSLEYPIKEAIESVIRSFGVSASQEKLLAYSSLYFILAHFCGTCKAPIETKQMLSVKSSIRHIESNLAKKPSSKELAALASLSESQFRRLFKSVTKKTPSEYRKAMILKTARNMLTLGEFTIGEIAEMLGFCDVYAFSHFFKKELGFAPSKIKDME